MTTNVTQKMYNQIEVDSQVCRYKVKKNKWARHVKTEKPS